MQIENRILTSASWYPNYIDRVAICNHIMQGSIAGSEARFNDPREEVSAHFGVGTGGRVVQWVPMIYSSWANGILEDGYNQLMPWLVECKVRSINPNRRTISIEHEGNSGDIMPEAQYQATLELQKTIIRAWPTIVPSRKTIAQHHDISPRSKPNCPGTGFPIDRLIRDLMEAFPMNAMVPGNFPVRPEFTAFWFKNGGLSMFGYPIDVALPANGKYGQATFVQYFERARFELQPDGSILLGLVGNEAQFYRGIYKTL